MSKTTLVKYRQTQNKTLVEVEIGWFFHATTIYISFLR